MRQSKKGRLPHSSPFLVPAPLMLVFTSAMLVLRLMLMLILRRTLPSSFDPSIHLAIPRAPYHLRALCLFPDAHSHPSIGGHNSCTVRSNWYGYHHPKRLPRLPPAFIRHPCIRAVRSPESTTPLL